MDNKKYKRNCPICGKELFSIRKSALIDAIKKNRVCKSCSLLGNKRLSGYVFSDESKNKISNSLKSSPHHLRGKTLPEWHKNLWFEGKKKFNTKDEAYRNKLSKSIKEALHKPEIRKKHIEALSKINYLGRAVDIGQSELIEKWNRLGFNLLLNYQLKTDQDLFYIDGYDKEKNVVLEYDSKYHNTPFQKQKDLVRQEKIIGILKPKKFWRYNNITKQIKDVLVK
jgi:very-short-patch-repair endonuclease